MTPTTKAGRALLSGRAFHTTRCARRNPGDVEWECDCGLDDGVVSAEREAAAEAEALRAAWKYVRARIGDLLVEESERSRTTFLYLRMGDVMEVMQEGDEAFALATPAPAAPSEPER